MIVFIVRMILSGLLLWGVFTETGVFTTLALALIIVTNELSAQSFYRLKKSLD